MKRYLTGFGLFALILMATLAVTAPASWLDYGLTQATDGTITLGSPQGTVWRGKGVLQAGLPRGEQIRLYNIHWTVSPLDLLRAKVRLKIFSEDSGKPLADMEVEQSAIRLHALQAEFPAALLGAFSPALREAGLSGTLRVEATELQLADRGATTGTASITWNQAGSTLANVGRLGDYRIDIKGRDNGLACEFSTLDATALKLNGTCQFSPGQPLFVEALAEPLETYKLRLLPVLQVFGKETGPGIYKLQLARGIRMS